MTPSPRGRRWSVAAAPRRPHPPSPDAPGTESRSPALSPGREAWRDWPKGRRRRTMTGVRQVGRGAAPSDRGGTCREPRWPQRPAQNSPPHSGGSAQVGAAVHLRMRRRPAPRWPAGKARPLVPATRFRSRPLRWLTSPWPAGFHLAWFCVVHCGCARSRFCLRSPLSASAVGPAHSCHHLWTSSGLQGPP